MTSVLLIVAASAQPLAGSSAPAAFERLCGQRLFERSMAVVRDAVSVVAVLIAANRDVEAPGGATIHRTTTTDLLSLQRELAAQVPAASVTLAVDPLCPLVTAATIRALIASASTGLASAVGSPQHGLVALALRSGSSTSGGAPTFVAAPDRELTRVVSRKTLVELERSAYVERANELLAAGLLIRDPATTRIEGPITFGLDVEIDPGCTLRGPITLGDRVRVGANCILTRATIGADTEIRPFTIVEDSSVGESSFVGPYARVRPGTSVGPQGQIGNFVELKAARLGRHCRINHLSFVGDATFADDVTIGAGTITCNHDGVRAQPTTIGAGAYVGSGCILVAPVNIGGGATIGAGSTITKDAPPSKLTLARTRQVVVEGWGGFESRRK